jgi:hypothetical protein
MWADQWVSQMAATSADQRAFLLAETTAVERVPPSVAQKAETRAVV